MKKIDCEAERILQILLRKLTDVYGYLTLQLCGVLTGKGAGRRSLFVFLNSMFYPKDSNCNWSLHNQHS